MDINDVSRRIARIISATGDMTYSAKNGDTQLKDFKLDGKSGVLVEFGDLTDEQLTNSVISLLGQISNLKDILKKHAKDNGKNPKIVEQMIDNSLSLQLITDIVNAEKHGYPTTSNRSRRDPKILQIFQAKDFTTDTIEICGRVVDRNNEWIIDLEDMIKEAMDTIEVFIKTKLS